MSIPKEQINIIDSGGMSVDIDRLIDELSTDDKRVLVNDEFGIIIYVADLKLFSKKYLEDGTILVEKLFQIKRIRFGTKIVRHQIGASVYSMTADTVFIIREVDYNRKIRADSLEPGMILNTGEKVFS
jgi:hypothetical protein